MGESFQFWDLLATHHARIENSYLDIPSLRRLLPSIESPVLVVGAGQGLIVEALLKNGFASQGIDLSSEMIKEARKRRGLDLVQADAKSMPFAARTFKTVICATGVIDFISNEEEIRKIIQEMRRVADPAAKILVAFYRMSRATQDFCRSLGLLRGNLLRLKETLEIYRLKPLQSIAWVQRRANIGRSRALFMSLRCWVFSSWQEKRNALQMQRMFSDSGFADSMLRAAPEEQAFRDEIEIQNLFARLAFPIKEFRELKSCWIVEI